MKCVHKISNQESTFALRRKFNFSYVTHSSAIKIYSQKILFERFSGQRKNILKTFVLELQEKEDEGLKAQMGLNRGKNYDETHTKA